MLAQGKERHLAGGGKGALVGVRQVYVRCGHREAPARLGRAQQQQRQRLILRRRGSDQEKAGKDIACMRTSCP